MPWTDATDETTSWTSPADTGAIRLVAGSPLGLLLTLTYSISETVREALWTDAADATTTWT